MILFFGQRWDAPRLDNATQVDTPVGEACLYCREPIEAADRGVLTPYVDIQVTGVAPVHMECDLRMSIGDVEHLQGRCLCRTKRAAGDGGLQTRVVKTFRQEARETLAWVNAERARRGTEPM